MIFIGDDVDDVFDLNVTVAHTSEERNDNDHDEENLFPPRYLTHQFRVEDNRKNDTEKGCERTSYEAEDRTECRNDDCCEENEEHPTGSKEHTLPTEIWKMKC